MPSLTKLANEAKSKPKSTSSKKKALPGASKTKGAAPITASTIKSTEYVAEDDESSATSDSESDEDEGETLKRVAVTQSVDGKTKTGKEDTVSTSEEGSEDEDEEGSSSSEESGSASEMDVDEAVEVVKDVISKSNGTTSTSQPQSRNDLPALHPAYKPVSLPSATRSSQTLSKKNLQGKQIFYITAPSSLPISSIKNFSLTQIRQNTSMTTHNNQSYSLVEDDSTDTTYTKILVPGEGGYMASSKKVDKVLHLRLQADLPKNTSDEPAESATVPKAKPVRKQPVGMKMRFFPIGVQKPSQRGGGNGEEEEEEPSTFKIPGAVEESDVEMIDVERSEKRKKKEKKRVKGEEGGVLDDEAERKRRKKEKKEKKLKNAVTA